MVSLVFSPEKNGLCANRNNSFNLLLRFVAPKKVFDENARKPLNLAIVIDRSGSMSGKPLQEALRCAGMILDRVTPQDRLSIVSYDNTIVTDVPSQKVENKDVFRRALERISSGGMTNLHGGWLAGAEQAALHQTDNSVSRVLLLSDGCANEGVRDPIEIVRHVSNLSDDGVQTSTYGLGAGFNEALMTEIARAGQGNSYYGQTADDLMDPFTEEFDLMSALCARKLRLKLKPARGVHVRLKNKYRIDDAGRYILPDLASAAEAWALVKVTVSKDVLFDTDGPVPLLGAELEYQDEDGNMKNLSGEFGLACLQSEIYSRLVIDPLVRSRTAEIRAAMYQEFAQRAARRSDWSRVEKSISRLRQEAEHVPWLDASIAELERYVAMRDTESFSKEAHYSANKMRTRLADINESLVFAHKLEELKPTYLRRKPEQGKRFGPQD